MTTRVKPLYYDCGCFNAANDSNYGNRMSLASKLMENISASHDNFFASYTVGSVFGFVLCRGDYNGSNCADRLNQTIKDYISVTDTNQIICPSSMDVTIYYDQHMVSFFSSGGGGEEYKGLGSNVPAWVASNMNYVMNSTGAAGFYGERVLELLNKTASYAASNSSKLYATGKSWFGEAGVSIMYGLAQCRPDMRRDHCQQCLNDLILKVPEKFTTPAGDHCVGGRILGVWCNLRFETELFFEVTQETRKLHKPKNRKLQRELGEWHNEVMREIDSRFSLYHFTMIRDATGNFSEENELGFGSFGFVYRAWHIWRGEKYNQLVDPSLRGVYQMLELRRRIQIALLCIQENPDARPHMREVSTMLSNNDVSLPIPQPPAYFNLQLGNAEASASNDNGTVFHTARAHQVP
nr:unnamed protein product [Digitaria exilis]